jgi:hypothetical protein
LSYPISSSPIGLKGELTSFQQDSRFKIPKPEIDISYFINYDTRFYPDINQLYQGYTKYRAQ